MPKHHILTLPGLPIIRQPVDTESLSVNMWDLHLLDYTCTENMTKDKTLNITVLTWPTRLSVNLRVYR